MAEKKLKFFQLADAVAAAYDADVMCYLGDMKSPEDDWLYEECKKRRRRKNVILLIATRGGDPHVAYRIARCLQGMYNTANTDARTTGDKPSERGTFTVLVTNKCKSAGTILALGANAIWMSANAEFGPIDVQLRKPDEVGERTSGLTPLQAIGFLENQSLSTFKRHFAQLRFDGDLSFSTKMSAELATNITVGLLSPIFAQIDPLRLAEVERSLRISSDYGERLVAGGQNLKDDALPRLVAKYPAHSFVIDRKEAMEIFNNVKDVPENVIEFCESIHKMSSFFLDSSETYFYYLNTELPAPPQPEAQQPQVEDNVLPEV